MLHPLDQVRHPGEASRCVSRRRPRRKQHDGHAEHHTSVSDTGLQKPGSPETTFGAPVRVGDSAYAESLLRLTFDRAPVGISNGRLDRTWIAVNDALCSMLGYTKTELAKLTWKDVTHPDDVAKDLEYFDQLVRGEIDKYELTKRYVRKDGTLLWVHVTICLLQPDGSNEPVVLAISEDITSQVTDRRSREVAEEKAAKQAALNAAILESLSAVVIIQNPNGEIVTFNHFAEEISGYAAEEVIGHRPWDFLLLPDEVPGAKARFEEVKETSRLTSAPENYWVAKDGALRRLVWSGVMVPADEGTPEYVVGIGVDVTERRRIEEERTRSEATLNAVVDATPIGILLCDETGRIVRMNSAARLLYGPGDLNILALNQQIEKHLDTFAARWAADLSPVRPDQMQIGRALGGETIWGEEVVIRHPVTEDDLWVQIFAAPLMNAHETPVGAVMAVVDVSGPRALLAQVTESEAALRDSEQRYRGLVEASPDGIALSDVQGKILVANRVLAELVGVADASTLVGRSVIDLGTPEDAEAAQGHLQSVLLGSLDHFEHAMRRRNGTVIPVDIHSAVVPNGRETPRQIISTIRDVSRFKALERDLEYKANYDTLTGLPNLNLLQSRVRKALAARGTGLSSRRPLAFLLVDLERFKEVNDTFGHGYGDRLLVEVAQRLSDATTDSAFVARVGGDKFAVVLPEAGEEAAIETARRLVDGLRRPFDVKGHELMTSGNIGVAVFPRHGRSFAALLRTAEIAMYVAIQSRSSVVVYNRGIDEYRPEHLDMISDLHRAIERNEFVVHYQPMADVKTGRFSAVEALVRWQHPTRGLVPPNDFIPLAERTDIIMPMTYDILAKAIRDAQQWRKHHRDFAVSVNLSARNLADPNLATRVFGILSDAGADPAGLKVELTESAIVADQERAADLLANLRAGGVRVVIDDFGVGFTALAQLARLPIDEIKIDRGFVTDMASNQSNASIVRSMIELGHSLGLTVVAEGVESRRVWDLLLVLGCDIAQGYYLSRPVPAAELAGTFQAGRGVRDIKATAKRRLPR